LSLIMAHKFSEKHPEYCSSDTNTKILNAINNSGPHTCDYIRQIGFDCKQSCSVKSPIVLIQRSLKSAALTPNDSGAPRVIDALPGAPVCESAIVPSGYSIYYKDGVKNSKRITVTPSPVLITGRLVSIETKAEVMILSYYRDSKWQSITIERETIAAARSIVDLAKYGVPVTSNTAKYLVQYLADYEHANIDSLPKARVTNTLGWQSGMDSFLLGNQYIGLDSQTGNVVEGVYNNKPPNEWEGDIILFHPEYDGNRQLASGFHEKGDINEWVKIVQRVYNYPPVMLAFYMALTAPFLEIFDAPNIIIDFSNKTSVGKTTLLRVAASCYGNPDEKTDQSIVGTWGATKVAIERKAAQLNHLPLILDETKLAATGNHEKQAVNLVRYISYMVANGKGKARGSLKGLQTESSWRTVLLSTGEQPIGDFSKDGGVRARIVEVWAKPFGEESQETAELVMELTRTITKNYGFAGKRLINYILGNKESWSIWRDIYIEKQKEIISSVTGDGVAHRLAQVTALISVVIPLVHKAVPELGENAPNNEVIDILWKSIDASYAKSSRAMEALQTAYNFAIANKGKFFIKNESEKPEPTMGWYGVWEDNLPCFLPQKLNEVLEKEGYNLTEIVNQWTDMGFLQRGDSNRPNKKKPLNGGMPRCYCLTHNALESLGIKREENIMKRSISAFSKFKANEAVLSDQESDTAAFGADWDGDII
jgi:putative DNA primase/helicase